MVRSSNVDIALFEVITSYVTMPDEKKDPTDEVMARKERNFSPSQCESERGTAPLEHRAEVPVEGEEYTSMLSPKWPLPQEVASKLEKVKVIKKIPIVKETGIVDLVAKFRDIP